MLYIKVNKYGRRLSGPTDMELFLSASVNALEAQMRRNGELPAYVKPFVRDLELAARYSGTRKNYPTELSKTCVHYNP
jgi:hypothetical protein